MTQLSICSQLGICCYCKQFPIYKGCGLMQNVLSNEVNCKNHVLAKNFIVQMKSEKLF